eukprot:COSAG03_NODE_3760_length_1843_cov_1.016055_2_plen_56_part_00
MNSNALKSHQPHYVYTIHTLLCIYHSYIIMYIPFITTAQVLDSQDQDFAKLVGEI